MRVAYLDCASTGISGDKFLGALLDAGYDLEELRRTVAALGLSDVSLAAFAVVAGGMRATSLRVLAEDDQPARRWSDIRLLLERAALPDPVRSRALAAFEALAQAESEAHDVPAEDVHFHEVGAVDSIVDIVGVAAGVHALRIDRLVSSPVAIGSGTVTFSHGTLPVPAPATARLLTGMPITPGDAPGELTTPTGAALVRTLADGFGPMPPMTLETVGAGAGTRELPVANVARLFIGETTDIDSAGDTPADVALLQANVDHLTSEHLAYAAERLREAGALDVWQTPAGMKKGRLGAELSALARPDDAGALAALLARETGSLGVRISQVERHVEPRSAATVRTSLGEVRVKIGAGRIRPEHDDVAAIARRTGMPYDEAARTLAEDARRALEKDASGTPE